MVMERIGEARDLKIQEVRERSQTDILARTLGAKLDEVVSSHYGTEHRVMRDNMFKKLYRFPNLNYPFFYSTLGDFMHHDTGPVYVKVRLIYSHDITTPDEATTAQNVVISFPFDSDERFVLNYKGDHKMGKAKEDNMARLINKPKYINFLAMEDEKPLTLIEAQKLDIQIVKPFIELIDPENASTPISNKYLKTWGLPIPEPDNMIEQPIYRSQDFVKRRGSL